MSTTMLRSSPLTPLPLAMHTHVRRGRFLTLIDADLVRAKLTFQMRQSMQVLSYIFSRMLSCGVTDSLTHILAHGDTEAQRLSTELVCLLARDEVP
jgi:hypothetical protein